MRNLIFGMAIGGILLYLIILGLKGCVGEDGAETSCLFEIAIILPTLTSLVGLWVVCNVLENRGKGFGPETIRALGVVVFIPALFAVFLTKQLDVAVFAALLGPVAGNLFSVKGNKSSE